MPLMQLACTAFERVPVTRPKIIEHLMKKFPQDLVFCRAPGDNVLTSGVLGMYIFYNSNYFMVCNTFVSYESIPLLLANFMLI